MIFPLNLECFTPKGINDFIRTSLLCQYQKEADKIKGMLLLITKKATKEEIYSIALDYDGYIKLVVDVERKILTGGGERHVEGEQKLLQNGSKQENLWGGGIDWETKEIDYNSIINLQPAQNNPSRDILTSDIRKQFDQVVQDLLLNNG